MAQDPLGGADHSLWDGGHARDTVTNCKLLIIIYLQMDNRLHLFPGKANPGGGDGPIGSEFAIDSGEL